MDFPDEHFGTILSKLVWQKFIADEEEMLKENFRVLAKGGTAIFILHNIPGIKIFSSSYFFSFSFIY